MHLGEDLEKKRLIQPPSESLKKATHLMRCSKYGHDRPRSHGEDEGVGEAAMKVVIDTNVIIAALRNPRSASARIVEMAISGEIQPIGSFKTKQEAARLAQRGGISREQWPKVDRLLYRTAEVSAGEKFSVSTDRSDNLFFEAAHAGWAQYIISNDRHLLEHDGFWGIRVLRPADFLKAIKQA